MDDLVTWLRAQLDDDEAWARRGLAGTLGKDSDYPSRMLAEVDAKRRIIDAAERYDDPHPGRPCTNEANPWDDSCELHVAAQRTNVNPYVLRLLALPYADRPGYLAEWAPITRPA